MTAGNLRKHFAADDRLFQVSAFSASVVGM